MNTRLPCTTLSPILFALAIAGIAQASPPVLPKTAELKETGDFSKRMVAGIDRFLSRATAAAKERRAQFWQRGYSSEEAYEKSVAPNRRRLRRMLGVVDERVSPVEMRYVAGPHSPACIAECDAYRVRAVRWQALDGVYGEGLLLEPKTTPRGQVVAIPDADHTPEMLVGLVDGIDERSRFAHRLALAGFRVIVPVLIDRRCTFSGNPEIVMTNQTHREWVYRQSYEMGRHLIGYEVQKVLAAVDWLKAEGPVGVAGYGEGGLIALSAAALDPRIDAALVSGYFDRREKLWSEPIYRNVFGLLREFGDAELASLIAPRALIVEHSEGVRIAGPPPLLPGRRPAAAPGKLTPPEFAGVEAEVDRARALCRSGGRQFGRIHFVAGPSGETVPAGSDAALRLLAEHLGVEKPRFASAGGFVRHPRPNFTPSRRQRRQIEQLLAHAQGLLRRAEKIRAPFWQDAATAGTPQEWKKIVAPHRERLWTEIIGRLPDPTLPASPRTRKIEETDDWTMYEVMLDVWPDVFAWGYLIVPKDIAPGERRPVVVCQHGLEGLPESVVTRDASTRAYRAYRAFAVRLTERGFVTYAPHNPYRGETSFRQLQRKANPLGLSLFSFILGQHQRTLQWLAALPFVDEKRIGFYGLSYGGTSAMRIPSLLDGYALSICSACFNDWTRKIMSLDFRSAYMFTREYEQFSFNLGAAYNHAEMAAMIAPRPFMVERGHQDAVAPDEWVAYEYAKVRRHYANLGIPDRTAIEFFNGRHEIHGQGTFAFLHQHLNWPRPAATKPGDDR